MARLPESKAELVLGPLLRHVGECDATVWVETSAPCTVEVLGHREHTWTIAGHHYALVLITGLAAGSVTRYEVSLDGDRVWPLPDAPYPSVIRTLSGDADLILAFGSCRFATPTATQDDDNFDADALDAYARRVMERPPEDLPDALVLLGDQVYADELSPEILRRIDELHDLDEPPGAQIRNFEEYTWLYSESWSDPQVRWLLSTVPSSMIFDDHDVIDDWNTSRSWRDEIKTTDWWEERIVGALSSYWIYQHLGNLSPAALADNELYQRIRSEGGDCAELLRDFASAADEEADGAKGRCGRIAAISAPPGCSSSIHGAVEYSAAARGRWSPNPSSRGSNNRPRAITTTCYWGPRSRGCCRAPSTTWSRGMSAWSQGCGADVWPDGPKDCGAQRIWNIGPPSEIRSTGSPGSSPASGVDSAAARQDGRPPRSACCPATFTTPMPRKRSSPTP